MPQAHRSLLDPVADVAAARPVGPVWLAHGAHHCYHQLCTLR